MFFLFVLFDRLCAILLNIHLGVYSTFRLERIAEELMGRRRWHQYQESFLHKLQRLDALAMEDWRPPNSSDSCSLRLCHDFPRTSSDCESISSSGSSNDESNNNNTSTINKEEDVLEDGGDTPDHLIDVRRRRTPPINHPHPLLKFNNMTTLDTLTPTLVANLAAINALKQQNSQWYQQQLQQHAALQTQSLHQHSQRKEEKEGTPGAAGTSKPSTPAPSQSLSSIPSGSSTDQPLDLSAKPNLSEEDLSRSSSPSIEQRLAQISSHPNHIPSLLQSGHILRAKPRISGVSGKRTYSEHELQAALKAIQNGELGTRRAAVIYGVPRSTLRNKVYKLALERDRDSQLLNTSSPMVSNVPSNSRAEDHSRDNDDDDDDRDSAEEDEEKSTGKPNFSMEDLIRISQNTPNDALKADSLTRLLLEYGNKQTKTSEDESPSPPMYPPLYSELWPGMDPATLPYLSEIISASASSGNLSALGAAAILNPFLLGATRRASPEDKPSDQPPDFSPKFPPLLDIVRRMKIEEQQKKERHQIPCNGGGPSTSVISEKSSQDPSGSNVILKVPSFPPKNGVESSQRSPTRSESSSPTGSVGKMGIHLRDVIANSINHKFNQPPEPLYLQNTSALEHFRRGPFTPPLGRTHNNNHHHPFDERKMIPPGGGKPLVMPHIPGSSSPSSNMGGGKGTRPKRGKYRNYDRDSLVEAVRAVQRGEMSVHRAGSYYGVPHSTLEYKVKERHLMRPRKREPKPQPDDLKRKEEGLLRVQPLTDKSKLSPLKQTPKPPFPTSLPGGPNGLKMPAMFDPALRYPGAAPPGFPFWAPNPFHHPLSLDFARGPNFGPSAEQFFASQMMQRMHEENAANEASGTSPPVLSALGKNAREVAESLYDGSPNGSFLDGIIRSSLEIGLSAQQKEEQSSNKTLLEQLCRNNRLSDPNKPEHMSSSEDERSSPNRTQSPGSRHSRNNDSDNDIKVNLEHPVSACDNVKLETDVEIKRENDADKEIKKEAEDEEAMKMETD